MSDTTKEPDDGGPAYPRYDWDTESMAMNISDGMSLRDWFAGQALAGETARNPWVTMETRLTEWCYQVADGMIKARKA